MDEIDRANDQAEAILAAELQERAHRAEKERLTPCGRCYWCDEAVAPGALFCRPDAGGSCRDDWQRDHDARKRNGG